MKDRIIKAREDGFYHLLRERNNKVCAITFIGQPSEKAIKDCKKYEFQLFDEKNNKYAGEYMR